MIHNSSRRRRPVCFNENAIFIAKIMLLALCHCHCFMYMPHTQKFINLIRNVQSVLCLYVRGSKLCRGAKEQQETIKKNKIKFKSVVGRSINTCCWRALYFFGLGGLIISYTPEANPKIKKYKRKRRKCVKVFSKIFGKNSDLIKSKHTHTPTSKLLVD